MKKRLLSAVMALVACLVLTATVLSVPRPSTDLDLIAKMPQPGNPLLFENEVRNMYSSSVDGGGTAFLDSRSMATLWSPAVARAWLYRYADNNLLTDDQVTMEWRKEASRLTKTLSFQIYLYATNYEMAAIDGPLSRLTNVVLIDDRGRRFAPIYKHSGNPEVQWYGSKLLTKVFNTVDFPLVDSAGQPVIDRSTKFVDLYVTCAEGKAKFHFEFEDGTPLYPAMISATGKMPDGLTSPVADHGSGVAGVGFLYRNLAMVSSTPRRLIGELENTSKNGYSSVLLEAKFYDPTGKLVDSELIVVPGVAAGASVTFEKLVAKKLPDTFTVEIAFRDGTEDGSNKPPATPVDMGKGLAGGGFAYRDVYFELNPPTISGIIDEFINIGYSEAVFDVVFFDADGSEISVESFTLGGIPPHGSVPFSVPLKTELPGPFAFSIRHVRDTQL